MAAPDLEVIKDIPGYKVILKAVLKSQIQQLVEQLAATTDEESVILTASVADGTLSHLGSESGKGFLEDHEDIKSQFLGFCLKRHHRQRQEKQRLEAEAALKQARQAAERHSASLRGPYPARGPRFTSPPGSGPVHPVAIARASRASVKSPGARHEPYTTTRPARRTSTEPSPVEAQDSPGQPIKLEANVETNQGETDTVNAIEQGSSNESPSSDAASEMKPNAGDKDDDASSESATSTKLNEPLSDADLSNIISGSHQELGGELDTSVTVKMEELTESDMDLEITGVEPGSSVSQDNWDPSLSMGMNFDPTSVTGNQDDIGAQGYNPGSIFSEVGYIMNPDQSDCRVVQTNQSIHREKNADPQPFVKYNQDGLNMFICQYENCCKAFATKHMILRHLRSHTKEKPFICGYCEFRCSRKDNLQQHVSSKHRNVPKNSV